MANEKDTIDEIIDALTPTSIDKSVRNKHKDAYTDYNHKGLPKGGIDYDTFRTKVIEYAQHHWKSVYGSELAEELAFSRALASFREIGGLEGALRMANKGKLSDVFKEISDNMESEHVNSYRQNELGKIDPNDWDKHVEIADKISALYKPLLKGKGKRKELMAKEYETTMQQHAQIQEGINDAYGEPYQKAA